MGGIKGTNGFIKVLLKEGFEPMEILSFYEIGSPKVAGIFKKNNKDYFIKISGLKRKKMLVREFITLTSLKKYKNIPFILPKAIKYKENKSYFYFKEEPLVGYEKIWGDEENHLNFYLKFFNFSKTIRFNLFPSLLKINSDTLKLENLFLVYRKELKELGLLDERTRKKYKESINRFKPIEKGIKLSLTHNDLNGNNILFNKEKGKYALTDWERAEFNPLLYDIGRAIVFSALHYNLKHNKILIYPNQSRLVKLSDVYLNKKEKGLLKHYFLLDNLKRLRFYRKSMKIDKRYNRGVEFCIKFINQSLEELKNE